MLDTLLLFLSCSPAVGLAPAPVGPATPPVLPLQDEQEKPDKREVVKDLIDQLKDHAKARGKEDQEAIAVVDNLLQEFDQSGLKDRSAISKAVGDCLKEKRPEIEEGKTDNRLYLACAVALGRMGPESVKPLEGWIGHKQHRKDIGLQKQLILSLGKTKEEKAIKTLTDLLVDKTPTVQGAAAEALANYVGLPSDDRKEVFEEVLKVLTAVKNSVDSDVENIEARERYDVIAAPMITTLQVLSGHDERDPSRWRAWWNDNKRRDWDKEG